jgi:hypothetical protein
LILKDLKVLCFDTLLQVRILKDLEVNIIPVEIELLRGLRVSFSSDLLKGRLRRERRFLWGPLSGKEKAQQGCARNLAILPKINYSRLVDAVKRDLRKKTPG